MQFFLQYDSYEANPNFDWMVLIHGAGGSAQTWHKQIDDFKQHFNLLVVDLRDHGRSKVRNFIGQLEYTIHGIAKDVLNLLEHLKIEKCHFMGVSLGSVIIRAIEELKPQTVRSVVLVGGIFKINFKLNVLLQSGVALSRILPFHTLYKLLAHIVLPRNNHKNSRSVFIREAKKIQQDEFLNWLRITKGINQNLKRMFSQKLDVPYLIVMGSQDHVFLTPAIEYTKKYHGVFLEVIDRCGHVCNLERAKEFNQRTLQFFEEKFPKI